jgi:transposase
MIRLGDEQWERIRNHFPEEHIPDGRPGRKPIPTRRVLEAVLWILNTGAQWHMGFSLGATAKFCVKF